MKTLTPDQTKLGFIGLGNMGSRLAKQLLDHGFNVTVFDRDVTKTKALAAKGATVLTNIA